MLNFKINEDRCSQCGKCVAECPPHCIVMEHDDFPSIPAEEACLRCQRCLAICPTAAISIMSIDPDKSLELKYSLPTAQFMETLIKGRRSTRCYKKQALETKTIQKLLETAWHAPTASNSQSVLFTATMNMDATESLRRDIFAKLAKMLAGLDPEDDNLLYQYARKAYDLYSEQGIDIVLGGAPHILIASAPKISPAPMEDCIIALTTFELLAQTIGVGTVWSGILNWCMTDFFPQLATKLGVPEDHKIAFCMSFGKPTMQYSRTVQRGPAGMNLVDSFQGGKLYKENDDQIIQPGC